MMPSLPGLQAAILLLEMRLIECNLVAKARAISLWPDLLTNTDLK